MKEQARSILPEYGQRALIIGPTGSGKTQFGAWMLRRLPQSPVIIMDTKGEESFPALPKAQVVSTWDDVHKAANDQDCDYVVFRPDDIDPEVLDEHLADFFDEFEGTPIYLDEVGDFHTHTGYAGPGLMHLLRKGRSRGLTTVMSTQRPAFISGSLYSETQKFFVFALVHEDDRKRVAKFIPEYKHLKQPGKYEFYYYEVGDVHPFLMPPVELDKPIDTSPSIGAASETPKERYDWL